MYFLCGRRIVLRAIAEGDAEHLQAWQSDPKVREDTTTVFPITLATERSRLIERETSTQAKYPTEVFLIIQLRKSGQPIGCIMLKNINWVHRTAETGTLVGETRYWGNGYGTEANTQARSREIRAAFVIVLPGCPRFGLCLLPESPLQGVSRMHAKFP